MTKRIVFKCVQCGIETSKTAPNYYKQKRTINIDLCGKCAIKRNIEISTQRILNLNKQKLDNKKLGKPFTHDVVKSICPICNKTRFVEFRGRYKLCPSCAIKKSRQDHLLVYQNLSRHRINNKEFSQKVSNGMLQIPKENRIASAKKAALWWKDEIKKSIALTKRLTNEYRQKMRDIWIKPGFKEKMSNIASKHMLKLWRSNNYREKQAINRLQQPKTSFQQNILYSILDDLNIEYFKDDSIECKIGYYIFDCRMNPQINFNIKKRLLIEIQGDYWHSLPKSIRNDKSKSTYLKTYFQEFDLKYLWEHEFDNKDRIIDLLKYWLGISYLTINNIDFNLIKQEIIDHKDAELFISKYHYAGRLGRSGINLGYFIENKLIAVIIYNNPMRQETALKQNVAYNKILELSRLAIHPNYQVKNLASNIIAKSINYIKQNKSNINLLVSFADSTYNHLGTIYKASNWILDGKVAPDYWYADNNGYICHKKTLWNKAKKNSMTENEYCIKYNYSKIWGDEKYRYIYRL